ncbi:MAG: hypothetical protein HYS20_10725 [Rhodocyclales bacterium]|nr:hypothetical protein [Rhodocyclales bacterium]
MTVTPDDAPFDHAAWQTMLDAADLPDATAWIGVLGRVDFAARHGRLLLWRRDAAGVRITTRAYDGVAGDDVALLLVVADAAVTQLLASGLERIPALVRDGTLHPYMLMTLDGLEDAGLADFVEDMGLVFPKH